MKSKSKGSYNLPLAIHDTAGNLPSVKFATANYSNGSRHPVGMVDLNNKNVTLT